MTVNCRRVFLVVFLFFYNTIMYFLIYEVWVYALVSFKYVNNNIDNNNEDNNDNNNKSTTTNSVHSKSSKQCLYFSYFIHAFELIFTLKLPILQQTLCLEQAWFWNFKCLSYWSWTRTCNLFGCNWALNHWSKPVKWLSNDSEWRLALMQN